MEKLAPYIEYIDETPINFRKIVKKFSNDGVWEDRVFYQMILPESKLRDIREWLTKQYGASIYGNNWWATYSTVVMRDKIYTHWKLLE